MMLCSACKFLIAIIGLGYGLFVSNSFKGYVNDIYDDQYLTIVGSISSVLNGLSRGVWAALQDKFGFKKIYFTILCLEVSSSLSHIP